MSKKARAMSREGATSMQPTTILCDAHDAQGRVCGATAEVRQVHYKYVPHLDRQRAEFQQVLSETHYEIDCPRCGWRTQVETVDLA
jgi:hypothetical protein